MAALAHTVHQRFWSLLGGLFLLLALLVGLSPAEATLGSVVKIVYLHGALERIGTYAFLLAALAGVTHIFFSRSVSEHGAQALSEVAIGAWLAQIVVSLPAQILAWGGITWSEPRVASALVILGLTALVYLVMRWIDHPAWMALGAVVNALILIVILRETINVLHPVDPILGSDSLAIRLFYAAIVMTLALMALLIANERVARLSRNEVQVPNLTST
ncbi:MAG TPA: hypothetical protein VIX58_03875 [Anaerolineae bacterium]